MENSFVSFLCKSPAQRDSTYPTIVSERKILVYVMHFLSLYILFECALCMYASYCKYLRPKCQGPLCFCITDKTDCNIVYLKFVHRTFYVTKIQRKKQGNRPWLHHQQSWKATKLAQYNQNDLLEFLTS